ncbi:2Fe-2S iron-sulfur cluster-binding protein [Kistimonas asteriae]|uniref:2Fe-2S iron-sulfur cluster-binding protein n=1 Tax=Kistimonas asteriae TaxID=517724 RepID=UPI001BAB450E|nr:2Fe-2S iron-sulfur cluster-binding protein [Kistimonas asteriae]
MVQIHFGNKSYQTKSGKSLLETLLEQHCRIPWSCRAGLCHSCLMQTTQGSVPKEACSSLSQDQVESGFFLACQCYPTSDITVRLPERHLQPQPAVITGKDFLSPTLLAIRLAPRLPLQYRPGQHILLWRNTTDSSRYCLLSQPELDSELLIHVERRAGGKFSRWLFDEAACGTQVTLSELAGQCHYQPGRDNKPTILFGSGVGIGAAMAITRDTLLNNPSSVLVTLLHADTESPEAFFLRHHDLPESLLQTITLEAPIERVDELLAERRFQNAQIKLIGQNDSVLTLEHTLKKRRYPDTHLVTQPFSPIPSA